jgi:hypothetical protein
LEKDTLIEKSNLLIRQLIQAQSFTSIENNTVVKTMIKPEKPVYLEPVQNIMPSQNSKISSENNEFEGNISSSYVYKIKKNFLEKAPKLRIHRSG